ncbi:kinase-like protein [Sistotremastrum niveocremeum HHB9708]|uniref:Kinase-like protein n=1 Tax=Sistotremastrum niveocremeum HHB9708 TaxID=1314777 RepID=A0A165A829_9AGAM|nr:kinase-like protein [Sistotremastrum niveocremeum HHB9708]
MSRPPPSRSSSLHIKQFTLTSKPNWWLVEVDNQDTTQGSFASDDTAISSQPPITPPVSSSRYKPADPHPSSLFTFPSHSTYAAPPNPFSHLSPIATGSTSEIYKCVIKRPDIVQLEINGELQSNAADVTAQFRAELRVYSTLTRHRNILAFMGCLDGVGMVLEHIQGRPLLDVIRDPTNPLDAPRKVDFHNQLLSGLAHLHSFNLSHGDLSLLNVHIDAPYQTLKILDFGRSVAAPSFHSPALPDQSPPHKRHKSSIQPTEHPLEPIHPGTRPFTAPEVLREECTDPLLADAYSFGIILLCMDLGGLVDIKPSDQANEVPIDTTGCTVFRNRIPWYTASVRQRRRIRREDRMN